MWIEPLFLLSLSVSLSVSLPTYIFVLLLKKGGCFLLEGTYYIREKGFKEKAEGLHVDLLHRMINGMNLCQVLN